MLDRLQISRMILPKMNCSLRSDRHEYNPYSWVHIEVVQIIRRTSTISLSYDREDLVLVRYTVWWYMVMMWPNFPNFAFGFRVLNFLEFLGFLDFLGILVRQVSLYLQSPGNSGVPGLFSVATSFPVHPSSGASFFHPWELDAALGLEFIYLLASGFREHPICRLDAWSIPGLFDAIGLFTDEELVETVTARFIAVGIDFAIILLSSSCSCILFAIVLVQLVKLKFWAQQRELKWLM